MSVEKYPTSQMLGRREIVDGKVKFCLPIESFVLEIFLTFLDLFCVLTDLNAHFFFVTLQAGKYKWLTYKEVYDLVIKVGNSIRSCGYGEVSQPCLCYQKMKHFPQFFK